MRLLLLVRAVVARPSFARRGTAWMPVYARCAGVRREEVFSTNVWEEVVLTRWHLANIHVTYYR
jgi:hypothetical protein